MKTILLYPQIAIIRIPVVQCCEAACDKNLKIRPWLWTLIHAHNIMEQEYCMHLQNLKGVKTGGFSPCLIPLSFLPHFLLSSITQSLSPFYLLPSFHPFLPSLASPLSPSSLPFSPSLSPFFLPLLPPQSAQRESIRLD